MVAMGTSLSDRAWGRESAVYRISGVLTVILGWFFTAFSAFVAAFLIAFAISYGGIVAIVVLVAIVSYSIYKTHSIHRKRNAAKETKEKEMIDDATLNGENILASCRQSVSSIVISVSKQYYLTIDAFLNEDRKALKKVRKEIKTINSQTKGYKDNLYKTIRLLEEDSIDSGPYYVQVLDYLRETAHCLNFISEPMFEHVDNNHAPFNPDQQKDLMALNEEMSVYFNYVLDLLKKDKFQKIDEIIENQNNIQEYIGKLNKSQLKRIKRGEAGTKNSLLYLNTLTESKNLILNVGNAVKAQRDFISYQDQNSNSRK
jgi:Na+/phosphate symporter